MENIILMAEGRAEDAETALRSFGRAGLTNKIHVTGDGPETLDFLFSRRMLAKRRGGQPILILLDLALPLLSGLEVLRIIKADSRGKKIPVVVLTSTPSDLDIHAAMKFGADSFLEKPITFHKLLPIATRHGISLSREKHEFTAVDRPAR